MKQLGWILAAVVVGVSWLPLRAAGEVTQDPFTRTLKGLTGVGMVVEGLAPAVESAGLHKDELVTDAELRLRTAGIKILSEAERLNTPGSPCLYVSVSALPEGSEFVYFVEVELLQDALLDRGEGLKLLFTPLRKPCTLKQDEADALSSLTIRHTVVSTWDTGRIGYGPLESIHQAVRDQVDKFANAFLAANPKK